MSRLARKLLTIHALSVAGGGAFAGHISTWDTTNTSTGSSTSTQIALPLESGGTYNFEVDWGDGSSDTITAWDQAETTHTYSASGEYEIRITGQCEGFRFNNSGDRNKMLSISQWGNAFRLGNNGGYFYGCQNLTSVPSTAPLGVTDMSEMFRLCGLFNADISAWDVSAVTSMSAMFIDAASFNQDIGGWDLSSVTSVTFMFIRASSFNQDIGSWDVSGCSSFQRMFDGASSFDQDIGTWDITSVTDMTDMLKSVTLSTPNYDALLTGWEAQAVQNNVPFHGGNSQYSAGAPATARQALIDDHTWTITDGGQVT